MEYTHATVEKTQFSLTPVDNRRLAILCGQCDEHLQQLENYFGVKIKIRGNTFQLSGEGDIAEAQAAIESLYLETAETDELNPEKIHYFLLEKNQKPEKPRTQRKKPLNIKTRLGKVKILSKNQQTYVENIEKYDVNFAIGPAGTGKTYLAVACAVHALENNEVRRILLTRPVVEAGENLGFLPGDLSQKIDPYLRPLYDALYEMLGFEVVSKYIERNIIEIAPLAYMRGRTLSDAFIILDESQNTTREQMKMLLTRIGFGSKTVITGDVTQTDLSAHKTSGLQDALNLLSDVDGIHFNHFDSEDVVRHPIVQRIVEAYAKDNLNKKRRR